MNFIKRFIQSFTKSPNKAAVTGLTFAFEVDGKSFYKYPNEINLPAERFFAAMGALTELEMRTTRSFLVAYTESVDRLLKEKKYSKINEINEDLKSRSEWLLEPEIVYKLAAILYIGEDEDPTIYDSEVSRAKINFWKKKAQIDFFYKKPIQELLPPGNYSTIDFERSLRLLNKLNLHQHNQLYEILSKDWHGIASKPYLEYAMVQLATTIMPND